MQLLVVIPLCFKSCTSGFMVRNINNDKNHKDMMKYNLLLNTLKCLY